MSGILKGKGSLQVTTLNLLAYRIAFLFKDPILIYLSIFVCCLHSLIYIVSKWWFLFSLCESFANLVMFKTINSSECIGVKEFLSLDLCSVHWHLLPLKDMPCGLTHTPNFSTCSFLSCLYWHPELLAEGKAPVVKTELHLILDLFTILKSCWQRSCSSIWQLSQLSRLLLQYYSRVGLVSVADMPIHFYILTCKALDNILMAFKRRTSAIGHIKLSPSHPQALNRHFQQSIFRNDLVEVSVSV